MLAMWPHFVNLLQQSYNSFLSSLGTTSLGWLIGTIVLFFAVEIVTYIAVWIYRGKEAMKARAKENFHIGLFVWLVVSVVIYVPVFGYAVVKIVYGDHQSLVQANTDLMLRNKEMASKLDKKTHSLDTTDPVFPNTIYLLQAFASYRHALGGVDKPCQVKVTAPPESGSLAMASMVAQLSVAASNCSTFGPMDSSIDPDVDKEAMNGMVPGVIVFHAAKGDRAADQLFSALSNQIQLRRSYDVPTSSSLEHFIWLQFGTGVKWNSQLR
jgi:hypothetical protein